MIDSLQEQVNNAKDKLLRLMSASQPCEDQDMDSSATNLNSSSTQTTELQSDGPSSSSLPQRDTKPQLSHPHLTAAALTPSSELPTPPNCTTASSPLIDDAGEDQKYVSVSGPADMAQSRTGQALKQPLPSSGFLRTPEETVNFVTSLQCHGGLKPFQVEALGSDSGLTSLGGNARPTGFVSSEQLQEILQELSLDAVMEGALRAPGQIARTSSQLKCTEASMLSPLSLRMPRSPYPPDLFRHPSISPYAMRKRRPPFNSSRRGLTPCVYKGCRKIRENCLHQSPDNLRDRPTVDGSLLQVHNGDLNPEEEEEAEEEAEWQGVIGKRQRCVSRSHRCSALHCEEQDHTAQPEVEAGGDKERRHRHIRDSCGYWDSDSSSSTDYCYYHRPYCDSCLQRGSLLSSSSSSSDSSDSEYEGYAGLYRPPRPVVFKDDLKPTFV